LVLPPAMLGLPALCTAIQVQVGVLQGQVAVLQGQVGVLQGQVGVVQGQMAAVQADLIRVRNASAHNESDVLVMPPNAAGNLPAAGTWVPQTRLQLMGTMSGAQASALLIFYQQAVPVRVADRRLALAALLGVR
jgi:hypothetical protein